MVYSAIGTTCFGLYLPSSGFYNIEEESINAVKTVRGLLIKRSLYQFPDPSVPSARPICKHGEKNYKQRKILLLVWRWGYSSWGCTDFEARSGYCIKLLSLWGTSFVGDLGGLLWV